jgi:hypothetical protein
MNLTEAMFFPGAQRHPTDIECELARQVNEARAVALSLGQLIEGSTGVLAQVTRERDELRAQLHYAIAEIQRLRSPLRGTILTLVRSPT